jgi:hypothetical protein
MSSVEASRLVLKYSLNGVLTFYRPVLSVWLQKYELIYKFIVRLRGETNNINYYLFVIIQEFWLVKSSG